MYPLLHWEKCGENFVFVSKNWGFFSQNEVFILKFAKFSKIWVKNSYFEKESSIFGEKEKFSPHFSQCSLVSLAGFTDQIVGINCALPQRDYYATLSNQHIASTLRGGLK